MSASLNFLHETVNGLYKEYNDVCFMWKQISQPNPIIFSELCVGLYEELHSLQGETHIEKGSADDLQLSICHWAIN